MITSNDVPVIRGGVRHGVRALWSATALVLGASGCASRAASTSGDFGGSSVRTAVFQNTQGAATCINMVSIIAITRRMAYPSMNKAYVKDRLRSTTVTLRSYLSSARNAAIQHGRVSVLYTNAATTSVWVKIDSAGSMVSLRPRLRLDSLYSVSMLTATDSVAYDARGRAIGLSAPVTYTLSSAEGSSLTVCVSLLGNVQSWPWSTRCDAKHVCRDSS